MFIKVAVRELTPATLIMGRLGLAALTLAIIVPFALGGRRTLAELRENWRWLAVVALVNTAIPFWLLSWGETRIDSGLASIIQAAVPIFNALIAFGFFHEVRVTGIRLVGVAVGFVGVALLVGAQPQGKVLGALAVVGMAFGYGIGGLLAGRHLVRSARWSSRSHPRLLDAARASARRRAGAAPHPGWKVIGSVLALGHPRDGARLSPLLRDDRRCGRCLRVARHVPVPPIALAYGAVFLDERFGAARSAGSR